MFQGDAVETPDGLEIFVGHFDFAEGGVADYYCFIGNIENGDTMVEEEGVFDDGKGDISIFQLIDRVELAEAAIDAGGGGAIIDCLVKLPGHSANDGACV